MKTPPRSNLQQVDVSAPAVEERLEQRVVVVKINERRELVERDLSVAFCVDLLHQRSHLVLRYLNSAKNQQVKFMLCSCCKGGCSSVVARAKICRLRTR